MANNDNSRRRKFYDQMSETYDLGTFEEFDQKMNNAESRKKLHDFIDKDGKYDIGTFEYFDEAMRPVQTTQQQPAAQEPASQQQPVAVNGNVFTESQLEAMENGAPVVQAPPAKYGTPEYATEVIEDNVNPDNPYIGKTRQQAVNEIGKKYFNEWYGQPASQETTRDGITYGGEGAYNKIASELAAYNIASPNDYGHIVAAIRNSYVQPVARQRVNQLLAGVEHVNGMNLEDLRNIMESREVQQVIEEDLRKLGISNAADPNGSAEERQAAAKEYEAQKDAYYQLLYSLIEKDMVDKYGYLPLNDARSQASNIADMLMPHSGKDHEKRILLREYGNMVSDHYNDAIVSAFDEADKKYEETRDKTLNAATQPRGTGMGTMAGAEAQQAWQVAAGLFGEAEGNKQRDPDVLLNSLLEKISTPGLLLTENSKMLEKVWDDAAKKDMDINDYIEQYVAPAILAGVIKRFQKEAVERQLPANDVEYVLRGLTDDSVLGMIISSLTMTDSQLAYRDQANAKYGADKSVWLEGARMATGMASDFWLWGGWGKIGGAAAKNLLTRRILHLAATKGVTRDVAYRLLEEEAKHYLDKRMYNYLMSHVPSSMITMGGAEGTTEAVSGITRNEEIGETIKRTLGGIAGGAFTGAAFGATGAFSGSVTSRLSGWKRLAGKLAGLEVEAGTLYTTEELQKVMNGQDAFVNPFEGLFKANVKLGFIKASANPLHSVTKMLDAVAHPVKTAKGLVTPDMSVLDEADVADLKNTFDGKELLDALTTMRPARSTEKGEREGYVTEADAAQAADAYAKYMSDPDRPWTRKQKVARLLGGVLQPAGLEVKAEIVPMEEGYIVMTRNIDGQCVQELHYDTKEEAEAAIADLNGTFFRNTTEALEEKINATDAYVRFQQYFEEAYRLAAEKMANGEELTKAEKQAIYLYQHQDDLMDIYKAIEAGSELSEDGKNLADIYREHFEGYVKSEASSKAFTSDFERENGLEPGTINKLKEMVTDEKEPLNEEDANLLLSYQEAMQQHLDEVTRLKEEEVRQQTEEANAEDVTGQRMLEGAIEPPVEGSDNPVAKPQGTEPGTDLAGEAAGTVAGGQQVVRSERRQAAYDRGAQAVENKADVAAISYESQLANVRLKKLFPDSDPVLGRLRQDIMAAVRNGNDAEADRLIQSNAGYMTASQKEAIEQWRDAMASIRGLEDSVQRQVQQYEQQVADQLKPITAPNGTVTELQLSDGTTAYWLSGELDNKGGAVMVTDQSGQTKQIPVNSVTAIGESMNADAMVRQQTDAYKAELEGQIAGIANGSAFLPGSPVDLVIGGSLFSTTMAGTDPAGNYVFTMDDGSQIPMNPDEARQAVADAVRIKMQQQLLIEESEAARQQQEERFGKGIVGYAEGKPDLSADGTDPKAAAEYLESNSDGKADGHTTILQGIQAEIDRLNSQPSEENARRRKKWGEIRQALMTDEERQKFEKQRQQSIRTMENTVKQEIADEQRQAAAAGETAGTEAIPTGQQLLDTYQEQGDASDYVDGLRKALKAQYRDDLYPRLSEAKNTLNDYQAGLTDMTDAELHDLVKDIAKMQAEETDMIKRQDELGKLASSLGRLYAGRNKAALSPHEQKMAQLSKETNRDKKLKLARDAFGDDPEALAVLDNMEPQDVYEWIAENLGAGSINWEGMQRGEHYVRGLRDELGKDKTRGLDKKSDTFGFNYFLAPEGKGKGIDEIVHNIAEGSPYDTEEVKNALLDMLSSASRPTDISHRIVDDRIARAEEIYNENLEREREAEEEAKREAEDAAIMEMTGMTPDEYDAFISDLEQRLAEQEGYKTSDEYFNQLAEEYDRENKGSAGGSKESSASEEQGKEIEQAGTEAAGEANIAAVNAVVNKLAEITSKYHSLAPVVVVSMDNLPEEFAGVAEKLKEKKIEASYHPITKKIYIFADNFKPESLENSFLHENLHRGLHQYYGEGLREIAEAYWDASTSEASEKNKAAIAEEYADQPDEIKEEYLVHTMTKNMTTGHVDRLIERLSPEHQEIIDNILKNIGYDRAKEAAERRSQQGSNGENKEKVSASISRQGDRDSGGVEEPIQGLNGYTEKDVTDLVRQHFADLVGGDGVEIVDMKVIGSRVNGDADADSDLDVLLEYQGDMKEDDLFNILNDEDGKLYIEGIPVDINPITKGKSGTIAEFLERNKDYQKESKPAGETAGTPETESQGTVEDGSFSARLAKAKEETDVNPTEEQKKAGNYKMGHISFGGYRMSIESPKGSVRSGVDANGKPWSITMQDTYGYIREKYSKDNDHIDFFINDDADLDTWNGRVCIIDQKNEDGTFDEHKVMYGYPTWSEAKKAYMRNYEPGWWEKHVMQMLSVPKADFDSWLEESDHKRKPFAEYFSVKNADTISDPVDQLLHDVKERRKASVAKPQGTEPSYKEGELEARTIADLEQIKKKRQKDLSVSRVLMPDAKPGSDKKKRLESNIAQAQADIEAIDKVLRQKRAEQKARIEEQEIGFAMVDRLEDMGFDVTTDPRENRRVRKIAEKDNSEEGKLRHFETKDGQIYGFVYKGKMYLDPRKIDGNMPLHEYAHPWCEAFRRMNPEGWKAIVDLMKGDKDTWDFVKSLNPDLKDDGDIAEEMIAKGSGEAGQKYAEAEFERMNKRDPNWKSKWGNIWQNISKAIQDFWKKVGDFLHIKYESPEQVYDQVVKDFANKINPRKRVEEWLKERDKEYMQAVESGDEAKAKELFDEALRENVGNGITPYVSAGGYRGKMQQLAHGVKTRDPKVIAEVADLMAPIIPKDAVLVPAPSHTGEATDMLDLANAISERTGAPVADVLTSAERQSQYEAKKAGEPLSTMEMGIKADKGQLPEGKLPVVIDNVVDTGNTAEACIQALGKGVVASLADSKGRYKRVSTLKSAEPVVTDKKGNVVPLSDRFQFMVEGSLFTDADFEPVNEYGLDEDTDLGKRLTELKKQAGEHGLVGYNDPKAQAYVIVGNDAETASKVTGGRTETGDDGMERLSIPYTEFDKLSPKLVKEGYKMAFLDDAAKPQEPEKKEPKDAVDKMLNEVERRKNEAERKADEAEAKDIIDEYLKELPTDKEEDKVRKRATKAVLKVLKDAKVPYRLADDDEERAILKLFSMTNKEAVKDFARKMRAYSTSPHARRSRYAVCNMEDPFGVPMYAEKLSVAKNIYDFVKRSVGSHWQILDIGYPGEVVEKSEELRKAAEIQAMMGWHGSGAKFDAFDHRYMGSGEGNQSYGWGTYITTVEGIGRMYASNIGNQTKDIVYHDGKEIDATHIISPGFDVERKVAKSLARSGGHKGSAIASILNDIRLVEESIAREPDDKDFVESGQKHIDFWKKCIESLENDKWSYEYRGPQHMLYKVDIPDDNGKNYFDWTGYLDEKEADKILAELKKRLLADEEYGWNGEENEKRLDKQLEAMKGFFGATFYGRMAVLLGNSVRGAEIKGKRLASELLSDLGYVGIKYPAEYQTGGRDDGAKNYVIFNEGDAKITDTIQFMVEMQEEASNPIGEKEVRNVVVDTSKTPLPNDRKEALEAVAKMKRPFINDDQGKEIKVFNQAVKHTAMQDHDRSDVRCLGVIDDIIKYAVKIGNEEPAEDEKGHTNEVEIYYCPVNIDGVQYSARLVVKRYENRGLVLDDYQLYDLSAKEKTDAVTRATGQNALTSPSASVSGYKVKQLIHFTQENDQKLLGISEKDGLSFHAEKSGILGWSDSSGVTMTKKGLNPNTPVHECSHLWDTWCQKENPELWKQIVAAMKTTPMWEQIRKNPNYRSIWHDDDRMASEVKSRLTGATSEEEFNKAAYKPGTTEDIINKVKSVLKKFWESLLRLFGKNTRTVANEGVSVEAIRRMTLRDLMNQDFEKVMKAVTDSSEATSFHIEDDPETIARLDSEPKEVGYRNVVMNEDGTMGPPMADTLGSKGKGKVKNTPFEFNKWERSDEHPELVTDDGKIDLGKPDKLGTVGNVDYNPYIHIRPTTLNKQFRNAWERPNLVYMRRFTQRAS